MEEIVIPDLDEEEDYSFPSFPSRSAFGQGSGSPDSDHSLRNDSISSDHSGLRPFGGTFPRSTLQKSILSHSTSSSYADHAADAPRLGKFSNGSSSSLVTLPVPQVTSQQAPTGAALLTTRKGSFASLKNILKPNQQGPVPAVPPVPQMDRTGRYPALQNPFRTDGDLSASQSGRSRANTKTSVSASPSFVMHHGSKQSVATLHSSQRSYGGRSTTSQSSSNFRAEDHPVPAMPNFHSRSTPSRASRGGRGGSDTSVLAGFGRSEDPVAFGKTPAEEALKIVYQAFRAAADSKIKKIMAKPANSYIALTSTLEAGADESFDALILSIANCTRRHARRVVDLLGLWVRNHIEKAHSGDVYLSQPMGIRMGLDDEAIVLGARRVSAARYIYYRTLIEIVRVVPREQLGDDVALNLEHSAFSVFRSERSEDTVHRRTVSNVLVDLLSELSKTRFLTVSDKFTRELSALVSAGVTKDTDAKIEHILKGVRKLNLRVYPESELEMAAEFIDTLSAFFANAHGTALKIAYAETFTHLLHPVIETATAEVNHPTWARAISVVLQRAITMASKPRYWSVAFPLVIVALAVSPREVFMEHWQWCIDAIQTKTKDRTMRLIGMNAFIHILWVYLNRITESSTSRRKRLEGLLQGYFPPHSGQLLPVEMPLEAFVAILHYVSARQTEYGQDLIADFLRDSVPNRHQDGSPRDVMRPDRAYVAVKAATLTLRSLGNDMPVRLPLSGDFTRFDFPIYNPAPDKSLENIPEAQEYIQKCGPLSLNVLMSCDRMVGHILISSDVVNVAVHASSATLDPVGDQVTKKHGDVYVGYLSRHEPNFRLLAALLEPLPSLLPTAKEIRPFVDILCRATFSACPVTCEAAAETMRRVADDPIMCATLVATYRHFIFETDHVFKGHFVGTRLLESQLVRVTRLWLEILEKLAEQHRSSSDADPMEPAFVAKIEGCGLFLLCSTCLNLRKLAYGVFSAARDLGGLERGPSAPFRISRVMLDVPTKTASVLQMFEHELEPADIAVLRKLPTLTPTDKTRLESIKGRNLIQLVAEGDSPKDSALWAGLLPAFIGKVNDQLPDSALELRSLVGGLVTRLQSHVSLIASAASKPSRATPNRATSDPGLLAEQWRLYLSVLCGTMNPMRKVPPQTKGADSASAVMISTALFGYLVQILTWDDRRFQDAAVFAMGSIRAPALKALAEQLLTFIRRLADSYKSTPSRQTRPLGHGGMWTAAARVFSFISPLLLDGRANSSSHLEILSSFIGFVKLTLTLLSDRREDYDLQSLRHEFCIVTDRLSTALGKLDSSDRFLGEEVRGAIFKLCADWCLLGSRPDVVKAREGSILQAAAAAYGPGGSQERAQYLDDVQSKTKLLSITAAEAMASLCSGKLISAADATPAGQVSDHIVEPLTVLRWIRGLFQLAPTNYHDTARKALTALMKYNWDVERLADEVLHQSFGEGEHFTLNASFFGVVADMVSEGAIVLPPAQLACLSLSKLGHPVSEVRQRAFQLAEWLFHDPQDQASLATVFPSVGSAAPNVYRKAQLEIATRLATMFPDLAMPFVAECTVRLAQLEAPRRHATLSMLPAFLKVLALGSDSKADPDEVAQEHQALSNLVYLAVRFSDDHLEDVREILLSFAGGPGRSRNTMALVKFLFEQGAKRGNPDFMRHARQIMACLADSPAGDSIFEEICQFVHPSDMATSAQADVPASPSSTLADLDALFASTLRTKPLSQGQMALLLAGELLPSRLAHPLLVSRLPAMLHVAFIHCDDPNVTMRESAQRVLFQVLRTWISQLSRSHVLELAERASAWEAAELKTTALASQSADLFWKTDDTGSMDTFSHAPSRMSTLVAKVLGILQQAHPQLRQQWGCLALDWATSCTVRHLACRSFQVFRILTPDINARMMSDMLARLSSTFGSPTPEIQTFNSEVLRTLGCIVQSLSAEDMRNYPQIFWCVTACLGTPYEAEFNEVIELFSHVLDKTNLADPAVVSHLSSFRPTDWSGPPPHLQALLLFGLRSAKTDMMTFDLIRRITSVTEAELVDDPEMRLLHGFGAALPWMLHSTDLGEPNEELAGMASDLAVIAEEEGKAGFARLLNSFAHNRFRSKDDFIRQAAKLLLDYIPTYALEIVTLLLGFVLNQNDWMRDKALQILALVLANSDVIPILTPFNREIVHPLLRLVSTKHAALALDVLDLPLFTSGEVAEPCDPLFGPIENSGWSVPEAKERSEATRNNVLAVFNTVSVESRAASAHFSVLQFSDLATGASHAPGWGASQQSFEMPSPPMPVPDNASMGDLVGALHSLNQFFDDGLDNTPNGITASPISRRAGRHLGRRSSTDSLPFSMGGVRAVMARGTVGRSGSAAAGVDDSLQLGYSLDASLLKSTESFTSSTEATAARPSSAQSVRSDRRSPARQQPQPGDVITFGPNGATFQGVNGRGGNLYVHNAQQPSFSSESDFGAAASDSHFSLDDGDDFLAQPARPWQDGHRSRTPSPRDNVHM
ncbi:hypothetical protein CspeluHIS016_0210220 [Cutaneotrichosporon spelunceum]|uniref:Cell polarity protein mor2 n=1 Tax=Cutaneotrichosporon spelunceum TaxID=1672016 RepID=A0AAD3TT11_9TREE|nr:hypothetical protein CspeluHIS016_0210220 [Cutaneotrichosporon spelunceum]